VNTSVLNPPQLEAVRTTTGRLLILAGAGSGKTRVLTARMAYLIQECHVPPDAILGLTFTNKAAQEMRDRISRLVSKQEAAKLTLCTFHSFCMGVLRADIHHLGFTRQFSLYDQRDVERMVKLIARDVLGCEGVLPSLSATLHAISLASQKGLSAHELQDKTWHDQFTRTIYERLQAGFRAYNALDFDHLLSFAVELFVKHPSVLQRYQERFRYIMIDEYQDTNPIQFRLAELLAAKHNNLCVVGDDDQAIYGWRGADVSNILRFATDAKVIKLEQNYRSHNIILKAAHSVIAHNPKRHSKALWSKKEQEFPIEIFIAPTEQEEAEAVAARLAYLKEKGLSWSEMAVLYRSNALSRVIELALLKTRWKLDNQWIQGIPFQVIGGTEFYERREIKDLLAYLRVILNPQDEEALLRIVNLPRRGIGEASLDAMTTLSRREKRPLWEIFESASCGASEWQSLSKRVQMALEALIATLKEAQERFKDQLADSLLWLIERIDFRRSIDEDVKSDQMRKMKWENVEQLVSALAEYEEKHPGQASLHDFVSSMALQMNSDRFSHRSNNPDQVSLMTFHGAKGLEFEACFLIGLEAHLIPHERSVEENGVEEERRLMYVAMTRAKTHLTLSLARSRRRMGRETPSRPSPFLKDIPKELIKAVDWHKVG
jgi:superfamily I DNA/RNA helicase